MSAKMPPIARHNLAVRLRQNWLARHPSDLPAAGPLDDSLTSLNWLQNLNIMKMASPTPPPSPQPGGEAIGSADHPFASSSMQVNPNAVLNMTNLPSIKQEPMDTIIQLPSSCHQRTGMEVSPPMINITPTQDRIDYKTNPYVKPPYSYATLICMAMRESKKNKITLSGIYKWITENFMYYRVADPSWQNSIRHNLSLNKCFQKVARRKDEPGKGGFWRINPEYEDMFVNGIFKKRRGSTTTREPMAPAMKRFRREDEDSNGSDYSPGSPVFSDANTIFNNIMNNTPAVKVQVKREPGTGHHNYPSNVLQLGGGHESEEFGDPLDFSWTAILNQDIEIGGVRLKTEDIIDSDTIADTITSLSPPLSETESSSDILEDILRETDLMSDVPSPTDCTSGEALDLTVSGRGLQAPNWWSGKEFTYCDDNNNNSGLNTPIAPSPVPDSDNVDFSSHPWAESRSEFDFASSFDSQMHSLFDIENISCPSLS